MTFCVGDYQKVINSYHTRIGSGEQLWLIYFSILGLIVIRMVKKEKRKNRMFLAVLPLLLQGQNSVLQEFQFQVCNGFLKHSLAVVTFFAIF